MDDFFTICTDLRNLTIEIDRISAAGATRNNNADNLGFLLHSKLSFQECFEMIEFQQIGDDCTPNITKKSEKSIPQTNYFFYLPWRHEIIQVTSEKSTVLSVDR